MLFNNLAFIVRRFIRQKFNTALHVVGLTLGITVCLMIALFIRYELTFDTYEKMADRTYRVNNVWVDFGQRNYHYSTPFPLAAQIRKDVSGIEHVTKVHHPFQSVVEINPQKRFKQDKVMMTDPEFLQVFDVKVISGNAADALNKPYQAVLTESTAKKFFGTEEALNRTFIFNDSFTVTVGAIIKDFPANTHLGANMLLSFADNVKYIMTNPTHYGSVSGGSTFITLPEGATVTRQLVKSLQSIYDRFLNNQQWMGKDSHVELELQPLKDVHFNAKYAGGGEWVKAINANWLYFFGAVGLAVLILACINFINLSTAQSLSRAKEIGVRKVVGAGRAQLIMQFLGESFLLVFVSSCIALLVSKLMLPSINALTDKQLSFDFIRSPAMMLSLLVGMVITAFLAGMYPAWIITRFQPGTALKTGAVTTGVQSIFLRKGLVVVQFTISICLLMALLLIGKQMNYMRHKNLGFNKDNVVMVRLQGGGETNKNVLRNELAKIKGVRDWSFSTSPPSGGENAHWGTIMSKKGPEDANRTGVVTIFADVKYPTLYDLQLIAGRLYTIQDTAAVSESIPEGQRYAKVVANEKLVKELGYASPQAAIGEKFWAGINGWRPEIVGVVKDFNVGSLHEEIKPTFISQFAPFADLVSIKINSGVDVSTTLSEISAAYATAYPKALFEFNFLDQTLDALYKSEARLYTLFRIFSILALLISCLGLWGLISYAAQQRVKEIGIRKVLGASVTAIVSLLTKDFIQLVAIAIAIATPLAYWGIYKWLQDFAFRINIGWVLFAVAGGVAIVIALVTVGVQALRAALANPANSLRSE
jgi:ABC-type antimicrobial peptide transport system permease subunit